MLKARSFLRLDSERVHVVFDSMHTKLSPACLASLTPRICLSVTWPAGGSKGYRTCCGDDSVYEGVISLSSSLSTPFRIRSKRHKYFERHLPLLEFIFVIHIIVLLFIILLVYYQATSIIIISCQGLENSIGSNYAQSRSSIKQYIFFQIFLASTSQQSFQSTPP